MGTPCPEYTLEEILSVIADELIHHQVSTDENYTILSYLRSGFYTIKEDNNE